MIFVSGIIKSTRLPRLNRRVNRAGSLFAGTHGQNDRGGTGDGVAAGVDHRAAGQAVGAVRDQAAVLVGLSATARRFSDCGLPLFSYPAASLFWFPLFLLLIFVHVFFNKVYNVIL